VAPLQGGVFIIFSSTKERPEGPEKARFKKGMGGKEGGSFEGAAQEVAYASQSGKKEYFELF